MIEEISLPQKPIYQKLTQDIDFYELFEKIEPKFTNCYLLESLGPESLERYSVIGFDPEKIIKAKDNLLYINEEVYSVENPYITLQKIVPKNVLSRKYAGGLIGYLGYEAVNYLENSLKLPTHQDFDDFCFGLYTDGLVYDKMTGEVFYFYYKESRSKLIQELLLEKNQTENDTQVTFLNHSLSEREHQKIVEQTIEEIKAGNSFQCEVGFKSNFKITGNTLPIYKNLRQINPSPFMYYLKFGEKKILGASPELLLRLQDGQMETFPLAGTIRRGKNEQEDTELTRELLNNTKEIAEHNMLVDLHRNDLGKVAQFGTVKVRKLLDIVKFSYVQHISSEITGIIDNKYNAFDALASIFPGGVVSGSPKVETMKIIARNEKSPRGPYGGAVGHFGFNGNATFALTIRSLYICGENAYTQTSSGIVYDSQAKQEYQEVINKLAGMEKTLSKFYKVS